MAVWRLATPTPITSEGSRGVISEDGRPGWIVVSWRDGSARLGTTVRDYISDPMAPLGTEYPSLDDEATILAYRQPDEVET